MGPGNRRSTRARVIDKGCEGVRCSFRDMQEAMWGGRLVQSSRGYDIPPTSIVESGGAVSWGGVVRKWQKCDDGRTC